MNNRRVNDVDGIGLVVLCLWVFLASSCSWCFISGCRSRLRGVLARHSVVGVNSRRVNAVDGIGLVVLYS